MTVCLWKRFSLLLLLTLTIVSVGCSKKVAAPPPPPPAPPQPAPPAPTITLSVDRASITAGQSAILSYTATNATTVTIQPGIGAVQPTTSGTRQVTPTQTTSFTARATGPGGSADSAAVNVVVNPVPPTPTTTPPPVVRTTPTPTAAPAGLTPDQIFTQTMVPILFDYDKSTIRPSEERTLLAEAAYLKQNPTLRFSIEGHADERGSQEYNIALGDERAASVKKYLAAQGIAENRMTTISYGEERPSCREQSEECYQKNRRAAFVMIR